MHGYTLEGRAPVYIQYTQPKAAICLARAMPIQALLPSSANFSFCPRAISDWTAEMPRDVYLRFAYLAFFFPFFLQSNIAMTEFHAVTAGVPQNVSC